jgi:antirestriction protein ArdC
MAVDVYSMVTDRIIGMLEDGIIPWKRPWTGAGRLAVKRTTGEPYSLLNQLLLGKPGEYLTFMQCKKEGGTVKKGAKSKIVVFWKMLDKPRMNAEGHAVINAEGNPVFDQIPYLQYSNVFHIDDCEGLEPKHYTDVVRDFDPIKQAEAVIDDYVARSGIGFEHANQGRAFYSPSADKVVLPPRERFTGEPVYYGTAFHELTHSTGHATRLNRFATTAAMFGSESYSKEELVAELGSASILYMLGIETEDTVQNNAAYIQNWINALRNDKRMIVSAAAKAAKAVDMIIPQKQLDI